jgi:hypothetical protein
MDRPCLVITVDPAGCSYENTFALFGCAVRYAERVRARHPKCRVSVLNADRMDADGDRLIDGLTDEEREAL